MRLSGDTSFPSLQGRVYVHTHSQQDGERFSCLYSELPYYQGYNPYSVSNWWNIGTDNCLRFQNQLFTQFGGIGINSSNANASSELDKDYSYGISGMQFQLTDNSEFSVVYQSYVSSIGWIYTSCDRKENWHQHIRPISAFRINLIPKTEKQYLIDYWNRDIGTSNIH